MKFHETDWNFHLLLGGRLGFPRSVGVPLFSWDSLVQLGFTRSLEIPPFGWDPPIWLGPTQLVETRPVGWNSPHIAPAVTRPRFVVAFPLLCWQTFLPPSLPLPSLLPFLLSFLLFSSFQQDTSAFCKSFSLLL